MRVFINLHLQTSITIVQYWRKENGTIQLGSIVCSGDWIEEDKSSGEGVN